jgi:cell division protein FtsB
MLAPLKNRDILECDLADPQSDLSLPSPIQQRQYDRMATEVTALRQALRESRRAQHKSATSATRRIVSQINEINRLKTLNHNLQKKLADYQSGQAIIELGRRLVELSENNHLLSQTAQRAWFLEKTLQAAHSEFANLAAERDALLQQIQTTR